MSFDMNSKNLVPGTTLGCRADAPEQCISSAPDEQSNLELDGLKPAAIVSSLVQKPSASQPFVAKMMMPDENDRYKKGKNSALDKRYSLYKKKNIFAGNAVDNALSDEEGDLLVKLWCKERSTPWMMYTQ